jgi:transcription antitermination factor NusG
MIHVIENRILQEQLLQEAFLDSVKDYAKEKYSKAITTINDWKDLAVVMGKVISDPTVLNRFADDVWRNFKVNTLKKLTDFLERIGLNDLITKIKSVVDKITNLDGWKKFLAAAGIGAMINYVVEKMAGLAPNAVKVFLQKYVSEKGLGEILSKLTDFKSYVGWLQPIIKGVDMLYDVLKSSINKFKSQANLFTQQINLIKKEGMSSKIKLKEKLTAKLKQEMSTTGTGASVTPGVGAGVATKYAFGKRDNKGTPKDWKAAPSVPNRPSKAMDYKELWEIERDQEVKITSGQYAGNTAIVHDFDSEKDNVSGDDWVDVLIGSKKEKKTVKASELKPLKEMDAQNSNTDEILTYLQAAKQNGTLSPDAQEVFLQWMNTPGASREEIIKVLRKLTGMYLNEGYAQFRNETKMRSKPDQFHQAVKQVKKKVNEINRLFEYMDRLKTELSEGEAIKNKKYTDNAIHQIKEETKKLFFKSIKLK